jgi:pimeloyl-ACP methyl ester carboxylesterase
MKKLPRWGRLLFLSLLVLYAAIVVFGLVADRFYQFRANDLETLEFFVQRNLPIHIDYMQTPDRKVRYVYTDNDPYKPIYLFIHGAPSSSHYYRHFFADTSLRRMANLVAVDRPGYGYSGFGRPEPKLAKQAALIGSVLEQLKAKNQAVVLIGASYGTSIACRLAMDFPNLADGIILIAPSLAPGEEKTFSISYILESPFFTWAQPRMIHSANVEKFAHEKELKKMENRWHEIRVPVMYMQGVQDDIIYPSNAVFARKKLINTQQLHIDMIPDRGHFLIRHETGRIKNAMIAMKEMAQNYFAEFKEGNHLQLGQQIRVPVVQGSGGQ